jgi:hypothetical protein
MVQGFHNLDGHLTDIKDMVIDQNEWYEEMFYDGSSCSNPSDNYNINDDLSTISDGSGLKKKKGFGAVVRERRADQSKLHSRQSDKTRDATLQAGPIYGRGSLSMKNLVGAERQSPPEMKSRNSAETPNSGFTKEVDSPASFGDRKIQTCKQELDLKFKSLSSHKKNQNLNVMVGEYAPVSDLVKSFQISEDSRHISEDQKPIAIKSTGGFKGIDRRH